MTWRCSSQFEELGRMTEGYSGADVAIMVRDALMEPIRTLQVTRITLCVVSHYAANFRPPYICYWRETVDWRLRHRAQRTLSSAAVLTAPAQCATTCSRAAGTKCSAAPLAMLACRSMPPLSRIPVPARPEPEIHRVDPESGSTLRLL
jgi:SpoVK/Ycf46/Vps4 family AAA+-type ATPase